MKNQHLGGCVCGDIRYRVKGDPLRVTICHCNWCQRGTGTGFGVEAVFDLEQVRFLAGTPTSYRHISDMSGRWLEMEFCPRCGANMGFMPEAVPGIRTIAAGTFDDPAWIRADRQSFRHVFTRSHRDWSMIPDDIDTYEEHFRP